MDRGAWGVEIMVLLLSYKVRAAQRFKGAGCFVRVAWFVEVFMLLLSRAARAALGSQGGKGCSLRVD